MIFFDFSGIQCVDVLIKISVTLTLDFIAQPFSEISRFDFDIYLPINLFMSFTVLQKNMGSIVLQINFP